MIQQQTYPLHWVADFANSIRPYIHLRDAERLLILLPNQAYRLNPTGTHLLRAALNGLDIETLLDKTPDPGTARQDTWYFFCDMRALMSGCMGDGKNRKAVEQVPFQPPFSALPILSEIALTYRCNIACRFCYAACNCHSRDSEGELSTRQVKRLLRIIRRDADVPSVSFTGGEPTLRQDLTELVAFAANLGMRVNLITNGTMVDNRLAERLKQAGLSSAQVSIEGPNASVHEKLTQVPGSFKKTMQGISALNAAGVFTQTNTTLNALNVDAAPDIVDMLAEAGLKRFAMNMLTPSGSATADGSLALSYTDVGETVKAVQKRAKQHGTAFFWYSPTPYCIFNPIVEGLGNKSCAACDGLLSIDPLGNVLPCSAFESGVGNLFSQTFDQVWNGPASTWWRNKQYAPGQCDGCDSFNACAGACPLYWQARGTEELKVEQAIV